MSSSHWGLDSHRKPLRQCEVIFQVEVMVLDPWNHHGGVNGVLLQRGDSALWLAGAVTSQGHGRSRSIHWLFRFGCASLRVSAHEQKACLFLF